MTQFITFEGGEGAGKTTHLETMAKHLRSDGYSVLTCHDPGSAEIAIKIRPLILDKKYRISREADLLLYMAARAELVDKVIIPSFGKVDFILCDRFYDSTMVYQGVIRGWGTMYLETMHRVFCHDIHPKWTFLFDVNPILGLNRSEGEEKNESRWEEEGIAIHTKINNAFMDRALAEEDRIIVVDANSELEDVFAELLGYFNEEVI
jgi:dTMP kinase